MLPDSNVNQLGSRGFVKFRVDLLPDLPIGTVIENTGYIYFDANPAIITNTTVNTIIEEGSSGIETISQSGNIITIYPNPFDDFTIVDFGQELKEEHQLVVHNILGKEVYRKTIVSGSQTTISKADIGTGIYMVSLINNDQIEFSAKLIVK